MTNTPNPEHVRNDLENLVADYLLLGSLPKPAAQENVRRTPVTDYGHPAQWASVNLTRIAVMLWTFHQAVAQQRNETPAPPRVVTERVRVAKAWAYLRHRTQDLIDTVDADDLKAMRRLHANIQTQLGMSERKTISSDEKERIEQVKYIVDNILRS